MALKAPLSQGYSLIQGLPELIPCTRPEYFRNRG
jgi:hypothetical protein